jgi:hypothetical protein
MMEEVHKREFSHEFARAGVAASSSHKGCVRPYTASPKVNHSGTGNTSDDDAFRGEPEDRMVNGISL